MLLTTVTPKDYKPPLYSNHDLLIADDVPGITHSILRLLGDDELRKSMA